MKIYTRTGDKGQTGLYGGTRVSKGSLIAEALGGLDELNSYLGVAASHISDKNLSSELLKVQKDLLEIGAEISTSSVTVTKKPRKSYKLSSSKTSRLERLIDSYSVKLPTLKTFILPGGNKSSSFLHVARTVARRTERSIVNLESEMKLNPNVLSYLNRLSDLLFTMARYINKMEGGKELLWK